MAWTIDPVGHALKIIVEGHLEPCSMFGIIRFDIDLDDADLANIKSWNGWDMQLQGRHESAEVVLLQGQRLIGQVDLEPYLGKATDHLLPDSRAIGIDLQQAIPGRIQQSGFMQRAIITFAPTAIGLPIFGHAGKWTAMADNQQMLDSRITVGSLPSHLQVANRAAPIEL